MQIVQKSHSLIGGLSWLTPVRKAFSAGLLIGSLGGYSAGNGHTTQGAVEHVSAQLGQTKAVLNTVEKHDIPALKSEAGCEHWRAQVAANLAVQPAVVDPSQIPADCPHAKVTPLPKQ